MRYVSCGVTAITSMVGHPCHNYGLITRFEVCNALRMWGYALCNSRNNLNYVTRFLS